MRIGKRYRRTIILGGVSFLLFSTQLVAGSVKRTAGRSVAIVCFLSGSAQIDSEKAATNPTPLKIYDLLAEGQHIRVLKDSLIKIAFATGDLFELGPDAQAVVSTKGINHTHGPSRLISSNAKMNLAPVISVTETHRTVAAIRVRGDHARNRVLVADHAWLGFEQEPGEKRYGEYRFEVTDTTLTVVYSTISTEPRVTIPGGILAPGMDYCWTIWGIEEGQSQTIIEDGFLRTVTQSQAEARELLKKTFMETKEISWTLLLAGYDSSLGLKTEACDELADAVRLQVDAQAIRYVQEQLDCEN